VNKKEKIKTKQNYHFISPMLIKEIVL